MTPRITGRRLVSTAALAGAAMVALAMPATAATTPATQPLTAGAHTAGVTQATAADALVTIKNYDGLCLNVPNGSLAPGTGVQLWTCNGDPGEIWERVPLAGGSKFFLIKNNDSGLCLSITNDDPNPGAEVIQWTCDASGTDHYEDWYRESSTLGPGSLVYNDGSDNAMHPSGAGVFTGQPNNTTYLWKFLSAA
jgi:Ricin-type beta-trefoil lectin domain-like